jgi:RimJ/RimL family protein N-acetyltransferase
LSSPAERGLHLVALEADTIRALHAGRADWATGQPELARVTWPVGDRGMLRHRMAALEVDPGCAPYLVHAVLDPDGRLVARIGCHAGPDDAGEVEIGYAVVPEARGQGVGGWVVDTFLAWLAGMDVHSVIASVGPDNAASLAVIGRRGFEVFGSQIDEEDGLELLFRRRL